MPEYCFDHIERHIWLKCKRCGGIVQIEFDDMVTLIDFAFLKKHKCITTKEFNLSKGLQANGEPISE